jgi:hypothetical protein
MVHPALNQSPSKHRILSAYFLRSRLSLVRKSLEPANLSRSTVNDKEYAKGRGLRKLITFSAAPAFSRHHDGHVISTPWRLCPASFSLFLVSHLFGYHSTQPNAF